MKSRILAETRKALAVPADALRTEWSGVQTAQAALASLDSGKPDETRQREVLEIAGEARKARDRADWSATVDAIEKAVSVLGEADGIRIPELRTIVDAIEVASGPLEAAYQKSRASLAASDLRRAYQDTLRVVREAKEKGEVVRGIDACKEFLDRCDAMRKEEPREVFAPHAERLFQVLKVDQEVKAALKAFLDARSGLDEAKEAEARGDLQSAFDILAKTVRSSQDVNFQGLVLLPLRVESRPPGAKVWVTLPAEQGGLVLFESWLRHEVAPNPTEAERISVSFNYSWF